MILSADVKNTYNGKKVDIPSVAAKAFKTKEFEQLVCDIKRVMDENKRVVISSVGASGRMAIQLDAAWRYFWTSLTQKLPTNKKLIDRSTRIILNLTNLHHKKNGLPEITYEQANEEFFKSYLGRDSKEEYRESHAVETLKRLGVDPKGDFE